MKGWTAGSSSHQLLSLSRHSVHPLASQHNGSAHAVAEQSQWIREAEGETRFVCCMGGTGRGEEGEAQTKNREMERKDAGREQKVKQGGRGGCGAPLQRGWGRQPLAGPCGSSEPGPAK